MKPISLLVILTALPVIILMTGCNSTEQPPAGGIVYPEECLVENGGAVIDISRPPYNADNTGKTDVTDILIRVIDDVTGADRDLMKRSIEILKDMPERPPLASDIPFEDRQRIASENPEAILGFERRAGTFPYVNAPPRIIYFPDGVYMVSNTISYSHKDLVNRPGRELNRMLHFQGQSEKGTVIRLADNSPGYGEGKRKAVVSFTSGNHSNVSMQNTFENISIEVGAGNPGAVGLEFFSNNTGAVRHVTVRSIDENRLGRAGVGIYVYNSSCALLQDISVEGFDYGVEIRENRLYSVMEHINVSDQRKAGCLVSEHNVSLRGLSSRNRVPAVKVEGSMATLALLDAELGGGSPDIPAIEMEGGFLLARNIRSEGYGSALETGGETVIPEAGIEEYISHECPLLFEDQAQQTLNLPIEETPDVPWSNDPADWVSVNSFGAVGDGLTDDTEAIRKAMNSLQQNVWFKPGTYLIDETIDIPAHVNRVNFMYCDLVAGGKLQQKENTGTFRVTGESENPLIIEDLFAFERYFGMHYLIDHASTRTLILSDLHTQVGAQYMNSVRGGQVFIENVCSTDQFPPYRNCFSFKGQKVWARQLNPERSDPEVLNEGGKLWVLGFKTEKYGTAYMTTNGGYTEILGGIFNISRAEKSSPMIDSHDSYVSVFASTTDHQVRPPEWNLRPLVSVTRDGETRTADWNSFPHRDEHLVVVPLFSTLENE